MWTPAGSVTFSIDGTRMLGCVLRQNDRMETTMNGRENNIKLDMYASIEFYVLLDRKLSIVSQT